MGAAQWGEEGEAQMRRSVPGRIRCRGQLLCSGLGPAERAELNAGTRSEALWVGDEDQKGPGGAGCWGRGQPG